MAPQAVPTPPPLAATASQVNIDCFGADNGSIDLTPSGGVGPYTFAWTGPGGFTASTEDISGLASRCLQRYGYRCKPVCHALFSNIATILEPSEILVTSVKTDISCGGLTDGTISITVTGGTLPYNFAWTGPAAYSSTLEDISGLAAGSYSLNHYRWQRMRGEFSEP